MQYEGSSCWQNLLKAREQFEAPPPPSLPALPVAHRTAFQAVRLVRHIPYSPSSPSLEPLWSSCSVFRSKAWGGRVTWDAPDGGGGRGHQKRLTVCLDYFPFYNRQL